MATRTKTCEDRTTQMYKGNTLREALNRKKVKIFGGE